MKKKILLLAGIAAAIFGVRKLFKSDKDEFANDDTYANAA